MDTYESVILPMWPAGGGSMTQDMAVRESLEHRRNGCRPVWKLVQILRAFPAHPGFCGKWGGSLGSRSRSSRDDSRARRDDLGCWPYVRHRRDRGMPHDREELARR